MNNTVKIVVVLAIGVAFEATISTGFYWLGGWMVGEWIFRKPSPPIVE